MGHDDIRHLVPTGSSHKWTRAELYASPSRENDPRDRRRWHHCTDPTHHLRSHSIEAERAVFWHHQWHVCHWLGLGTVSRRRVLGKSDMGEVNLIFKPAFSPLIVNSALDLLDKSPFHRHGSDHDPSLHQAPRTSK